MPDCFAVCCSIACSCQKCIGVPVFLHPHQQLLLSIFDNNHPSEYEVESHSGSNLHFPGGFPGGY